MATKIGFVPGHAKAEAMCWCVIVNSSSPGQNGRHFADDIFKCIFLNEKARVLTKISLNFVPKGPINHNPLLV